MPQTPTPPSTTRSGRTGTAARGVALLLAAAAIVLGAEAFSAWWMKETPVDPGQPVLEWSPPTGEGVTRHPELYDEVRSMLRCTSGWIGDLESGGRPVRISFFRWDRSNVGSTLEAFRHIPEACMGSAGMELQEIYEPRVIQTEHGPLSFDVTRFRPEGGGQVMFIYKGVWVAGMEGTELRSGMEEFSQSGDLKEIRLRAAKERYRPPFTRVLMAGISAVPTEELAWKEFRRLVEPNLQWTSAGELP